MKILTQQDRAEISNLAGWIIVHFRQAIKESNNMTSEWEVLQHFEKWKKAKKENKIIVSPRMEATFSELEEAEGVLNKLREKLFE